MEIVRKSMGFILLIIAVKLIGALGKDMVINVLYYSIILSFCLWMWGGWVGFSTAAGKKWTVRIIALAVAVTAGWILLPEKTELINWQEYDAVRIAQARQEQQPVLIKFTAEWCTSCSWVDKIVYQRKEVAELINQKGILAIKADTTKRGAPATIDLADKDKYNEPGVPVTVVFLPDGSEVHLRGMISKNDLKKVLDKVPDKGK
jgi:thiol:disulfide interchange protein DsbD